MIIIGIIVSILMFSIIVIIHELGHFSTARLFGVKVEEFGIGIPPRAKKLFRDKKGTLFTLNWLPIGGFVKLRGEMPNTFLVYDKNKKLYNNLDLEKDIKAGVDIFSKTGDKIGLSDKEDILKKLQENYSKENLNNKNSRQQAIIILAGVFMNFLFASIVFSILFFIGIRPIGINTKIETDLNLQLIPTYEKAIEVGLLKQKPGLILSPIEGSIAKNSGIKEGDILYGIYKDCKIYKSEQCNAGKAMFLEKEIFSTKDLIDTLQKNKNKQLILYINKNLETGLGGSFHNIKLDEEGKIGAYISENIQINKDFEYKYSFFESIKNGVGETYNQTLLTFKGLGLLLKKIVRPENPEQRKEAISQVSGPVGIVDFISNSLEAGFMFLLIISAIISINLGVFNLLPIPALDGGRFIFITINGLIEKLIGKKAISEKTEGIIHILFFVFLIALSLLIAYNDIDKIISR